MESKSIYVDYSEKLSNSLKNLKVMLESEKLKLEAKEKVTKGTRQLICSDEINELISISADLSSTVTSSVSEGAFINHGTFFDSVTTIRDLTESALFKFNIKELVEIKEETDKVVELAAEKMTVRHFTARYLEYSRSLSDISIISDGIKAICIEINKSRIRDKSLTEEKFLEVERTKNLFADLESKFNGIINRMKRVIGSISNALKNAFDTLTDSFNNFNLKEFLNALKDIFNKILNFIPLKLIEKMFGLIGEVAKLGEKYNLKIKEIIMTMPEIGTELAQVNLPFINISIPLPKIVQPKVSMKLLPI